MEEKGKRWGKDGEERVVKKVK